MKFALHFANVTFPDPAGARRLAALAEQTGFESLVCPEHVVWPSQYESAYPYSPTGKLPGGPTTPMPDPLVWMTFAAAVTTTLRFISGVMILPQRNPIVLAKEVATLDVLSEGRISLGVGVGWLREEFEALGVPFADRGQRTDEYVAAMRALWSGEEASFHGETVSFNGVTSSPAPVRRSVPILIGGHSQAAARRAGRLGNGFFPAIGSQRDVFPLVELALKTAAEHGRDPQELEISTGCPDVLPGSSVDPLAAMEERRRRGVHRLVLPLTPFLPDLETSLGEFQKRVIARSE